MPLRGAAVAAGSPAFVSIFEFELEFEFEFVLDTGEAVDRNLRNVRSQDICFLVAVVAALGEKTNTGFAGN